MLHPANDTGSTNHYDPKQNAKCHRVTMQVEKWTRAVRQRRVAP